MLQNYNIWKVLKVFLDNPTKGFLWRPLSDKVKIAPLSTKKYLDLLKNEGLLIEKEIAGRKLYFANRESRKYRLCKTFEINMSLDESGFIDAINKHFGYPTIVLFGSYANGDAIEESDVDIAIISESKNEMNVKDFERIVKKQIQIFLLTKQELDKLKKSNPSTFNGIINGYVISGRLEVV